MAPRRLAEAVAVHERAWESSPPPPAPSRRADTWAEPEPPKPIASYTLLGAMLGIFIVQQALAEGNKLLELWLFVIHIDWVFRPWTLVTSTLAHAGTSHLLSNGLMLFFFGPTVERIIGAKRFLLLFFVAGAISGVLQVHLASVFHEPKGALGASGALMMLMGILVVLMPKEKLLLYFIIPVPFWLAGVAYAVLDVWGVISPAGIGNFAHLSGMAIGLGYGAWLKKDWRRRGVQLVRG